MRDASLRICRFGIETLLQHGLGICIEDDDGRWCEGTFRMATLEDDSGHDWHLQVSMDMTI